MVFWHMLSTGRKIALVLAAILYVGTGLLHFIKPEPYLRIVPPYVPWHAKMVQISGVFEILGGVGLLFAPSRKVAAWGLVALLIAVFPANLYMATNPSEAGAVSIAPWLRWGRLPIQALLIWWILWCTSPRPDTELRHLRGPAWR